MPSTIHADPCLANQVRKPEIEFLVDSGLAEFEQSDQEVVSILVTSPR